VSEAAPFSRPPTSPVLLSRICDLVSIPRVGGSVTGVTLSSGAVRPGDLYAALPGAKTHGARFASQAVAAGAAAVLTDPEGAHILGHTSVPVLVHHSPRAVLGAVSALIYGHPAQALTTFGVTGTNGKTTVTYMLAAALQALGVPTGLIGTTGTYMSGRRLPTQRTTPEAPDVQALMHQMREEGARALAMEVSSHALVLGRVDAITFDVAAFTNLSADHLDFHADMDDYFAAKARLFTAEHTRRAVINIDDEWGRRLVDQIAVPRETYAVSGAADWTARNVRAHAAGSSFDVVHDGDAVPVMVGSPGMFNVANAMGAIAMLAAAGHPVDAAAAALASFRGVPGRMEVVPGPGPTVIVDYAHTPDAVDRALRAVVPLTPGKIWCVIGCGGDRDALKRPAMGRIAASLAAHVIVTDDNPRSEDPALIRAAVLAGARESATADVTEIGDREAAIETAIRAATEGDSVVILGKGHETGQEVAGVVHPFDDRTVARKVLGVQQ
jgi:UDP-N-acetylmuramoyl-L-alanyl-D-glutamate--2,6-diaminopimelate ligase